MSRVHKSLHLYRQPLSGDWQAVKVSKDGMTITDKYPLDNVQAELYQTMTDDTIVRTIQKSIQKEIKDSDSGHVREIILYIIDSAIHQITADSGTPFISKDDEKMRPIDSITGMYDLYTVIRDHAAPAKRDEVIKGFDAVIEQVRAQSWDSGMTAGMAMGIQMGEGKPVTEYHNPHRSKNG
ncbi:MAG: hypothetical protein [Bacteriophage sp.]|nr:MAG: hypothetical protein [Bacteriophage sp.]